MGVYFLKRRYKILLIILMGIIFTILINLRFPDNKTSLVALADGCAEGMTSYDMVGLSFNDYLNDYLEKQHKLKNFNNEFTIQNMEIEELLDMLQDNKLSCKTKLPIQQIIDQADILTIAIGIDEFTNLSLKNKLNEEAVIKYLNNYETFIQKVRSFYNKTIIIIGIYPTNNIKSDIVYQINKGLEKIAVNYKCQFLDIMALSLKKEYYLNENSYYLNYLGHKEIYNNIKKTLKI